MKRCPVFAVAALLFLLAVLLGSWVYLDNFSWHSGLTQGAGFARNGKVDVTLTLIAERCDYASGQVVTGTDSPIKGARLVSTHLGATTYSAPDGRLGMYVPFDSYQSNRQFILTCGNCRPEAVPLESRVDPTPGVEGLSLHGPWTVKPAWRSKVRLELGKLAKENHTHAWINGERVYLGSESSRSSVVMAELPWGERLLRLSTEASKGGYYWISSPQWDAAFLAYAAGEEFELEPVRLSVAFKDR